MEPLSLVLGIVAGLGAGGFSVAYIVNNRSKKKANRVIDEAKQKNDAILK